MPSDDPHESAWAFHETMLEILRRLNQAAERRAEVDGMEHVELERSLRQFWAFHAGENNLDSALALLRENGLVELDAHPMFAWDRGRVVGSRLVITSLGKAYLLRQIEENGRIR